MPDDFTVDASELHSLAADLGEVPAVAGRYVRQAVEVSARRLKDQWREGTKGISGAPAAPFAIDYEVKTLQAFGVSVVQAEIGFDKDKNQGALGNLIEFGGDKSGGLDSHEGVGEAALDRAQEDFERGLAKATADAEHVAGVDSSVAKSATAVIRGGYR